MNYKLPGVISLVLLLAAVGIAICQSFTVSSTLGIVFAAGFTVSIFCLLYGYCRKCPHASDKTCRHIFPGRIVNGLFKLREPSRYTAGELLQALLPIGITVFAAQIWLIRNILLFAAFWMLALAAAVLIRFFVCRECRNAYCSMCPNKGSCEQQ